MLFTLKKEPTIKKTGAADYKLQANIIEKMKSFTQNKSGILCLFILNVFWIIVIFFVISTFWMFT
jgi:hypothetical protein